MNNEIGMRPLFQNHHAQAQDQASLIGKTAEFLLTASIIINTAGLIGIVTARPTNLKWNIPQIAAYCNISVPTTLSLAAWLTHVVGTLRLEDSNTRRYRFALLNVIANTVIGLSSALFLINYPLSDMDKGTLLDLESSQDYNDLGWFSFCTIGTLYVLMGVIDTFFVNPYLYHRESNIVRR